MERLGQGSASGLMSWWHFLCHTPNWETVTFTQESEDGEERPYQKQIRWVELAGAVAQVRGCVVTTYRL